MPDLRRERLAWTRIDALRQQVRALGAVNVGGVAGIRGDARRAYEEMDQAAS